MEDNNMVRTNPFVKYYRQLDTGTNEEKYRIVKDGTLTVPRYLDIELTNACNFNCCFCPTGTKSMQRMKGFMPELVVKRLLENIRKYEIPGVRIIGWGEPTLHPDWLNIVDNIHRGG